MIYSICLLYFVTGFTDDGYQIIALTFMSLLWQFAPHVLIYEIDLTTMEIIWKIGLVIALFVFCSMFAMIILYISQLQLRLRTFNLENIKLLDGMHEGLLILSNKNKKVMFCNKPSQKLLKGVL